MRFVFQFDSDVLFQEFVSVQSKDNLKKKVRETLNNVEKDASDEDDGDEDQEGDTDDDDVEEEEEEEVKTADKSISDLDVSIF